MNEAMDEDLVRRAQSGDARALDALLGRHTARLLGRIRKRIAGGLARKVAPSDVLQEARIVAADRLADFSDQGEGSFAHWLEKIVELKIREAVRRYKGTEKRDIRREVTRGGLPLREPGGRGPTPSEVAIGEELREAARAALEKLAPDQREALVLLRDRRLTVEAAAGKLGRSPGAVKKLYGRAMARLEELLELGPEAGSARRRPTR